MLQLENVKSALDSWTSLLGGGVLSGSEATSTYGADCGAAEREILGAIQLNQGVKKKSSRRFWRLPGALVFLSIRSARAGTGAMALRYRPRRVPLSLIWEGSTGFLITTLNLGR